MFNLEYGTTIQGRRTNQYKTEKHYRWTQNKHSSAAAVCREEKLLLFLSFFTTSQLFFSKPFKLFCIRSRVVRSLKTFVRCVFVPCCMNSGSLKQFLFWFVLPPGKNDRPFSDNFVIWDPMNLVGGSNWSLGSYRFDEISTMALGQCFRLDSWFVDKNPGWKWWQVGKDVVVHVAI